MESPTTDLTPFVERLAIAQAKRTPQQGNTEPPKNIKGRIASVSTAEEDRIVVQIQDLITGDLVMDGLQFNLDEELGSLASNVSLSRLKGRACIVSWERDIRDAKVSLTQERDKNLLEWFHLQSSCISRLLGG